MQFSGKLFKSKWSQMLFSLTKKLYNSTNVTFFEDQPFYPTINIQGENLEKDFLSYFDQDQLRTLLTIQHFTMHSQSMSQSSSKHSHVLVPHKIHCSKSNSKLEITHNNSETALQITRDLFIYSNTYTTSKGG